MGGPCLIVDAGPGCRTTTAPPCTDNFQIRQFEFVIPGEEGEEGPRRTFHSCEHAFQAAKFAKHRTRSLIAATVPTPGESDSSFGHRVWQLGQTRDELRADWEDVKIEIMYLANVAKYAQHEDLQKELLSTGRAELRGEASTWQWEKWNGRIQMAIRKQLQQGQDLSKVTQLEGGLPALESGWP